MASDKAAGANPESYSLRNHPMLFVICCAAVPSAIRGGMTSSVRITG